ncbi:MAG TPA: aldehyde dehydrogenase family protein [Streptosporangiaceae bacterium]
MTTATGQAPGVRQAVIACGTAAKHAAGGLAAAPGPVIDDALRRMAGLISEQEPAILAANAMDVERGAEQALGRGLLDRLRLDPGRLAATARQLELLAEVAFPTNGFALAQLPDGLTLTERRVPIGVVGANFEARPAVTVDVASQLLKSRNAGVLRTGAAALASASALFDLAIGPALTGAGIAPGVLQLVRTPDRAAAAELVRHPDLIPLVILRGSGESTRALAAEAARAGVRTLAHADGGGVLYVDRAADPAAAARLITASLDRLGVCNRLNLLLICSAVWDRMLPVAIAALDELGVTASLPPHDHPLGLEWALQAGREATVTVAPVPDAAAAARTANEYTSGLAAAIVTADRAAAGEFLAGYRGTGAFWNASTRLLDGFKLRGVPETGINVDHVPGPRGPVTFADLCLRQYVVTPSWAPGGPA